MYLHVLDCPIGGIVQVTATKGGSIGVNSTAVTRNGGPASDGEAEIDTTLNNQEIVNVEIPEYPSQAIPAILSMLSFGLVRLRKR